MERSIFAMFGIGSTELLVIFIILFFIFGAKKLPEIGRGLGEGIRNFKKGMRYLEKGEEESEKEPYRKEV